MARLIEHESGDVDDQARALSGFRQVYEQLGRGRFRGSMWQLVMAQGVLLRESTNRQLREQVTPPPGHVALAMPLQVEAGSMFAGRPLTCESLMVLSDAEEYDIVLAGETALLGLSVRRELLDALAGGLPQWFERARRERSVPLPPDTSAAWQQALLASCARAASELAASADERRETRLLSDALAQAVMLAMSEEELSPHIPRRADTRLRVVRRAIDYMRVHLHDDIGIPEICAAACASRRSLQYCFEEFMHTTPQAYLRALRLNEARRRLKADAGLPITAVATEFGFSSASHFTRHYKAMFDELPSQTPKSVLPHAVA